MPVLRPVLPGSELVKRLPRAVGVTQPFERLVIEIDVRQPVRVYVKAPIDVAVADRIARAFELVPVADVVVDGDTTVRADLLCVRCGKPTCHMGDVCFACGQAEPSPLSAEARP